MHTRTLPLLCTLSLLVACGDKDDGDDLGEDLPCEDGFTEGDDGNCYEDSDDSGEDDTGDDGDDDDEPPTVDDLLDALPDCELGEGGDEIDLSTGCVEGLCPYMSYAEAVAAAGEPLSCDGYVYSSGTISFSNIDCDWGGFGGSWSDGDLDGEPDDDAFTYSVSVDFGYEGSSAEGIGLGVGMSCLMDQLGRPDAVDFGYTEGEWYLEYAAWNGVGSAYDWYDNKTGSYWPDGRIDGMNLYGPW